MGFLHAAPGLRHPSWDEAEALEPIKAAELAARRAKLDALFEAMERTTDGEEAEKAANNYFAYLFGDSGF